PADPAAAAGELRRGRPAGLAPRGCLPLEQRSLRRSEMPVPEPMKAQDLTNDVDLKAEDLGLGQFLSNPDPDRFAIERKVDGCRINIEVHAEGNRILSRGRDVSDHFPHLKNAAIDGAEGVLLDGELLAGGPDGRILSAATSLLTSTPENAVAKQNQYG